VSAKALKQLMPVWVYTVVAFVLGTLSYDPKFSWRQDLTLVVSGILSWMLIEYGLHRFIFHYSARSSFGRRFIYAAHMSHHRIRELRRRVLWFRSERARCRDIRPTVVSTTRSAHIASFLLIGVAVGYISYQLLPIMAHHRNHGCEF
jgi:hypothetical protein